MCTYLLLYNGYCSNCQQVAQLIQYYAGHRLETMPIQSERAANILQQVYPAGWAFAPYLVRIKDEKICTWAREAALWRLLWLLGIQQSWRMLWHAWRAGVQLMPPLSYYKQAYRVKKRIQSFL